MEGFLTPHHCSGNSKKKFIHFFLLFFGVTEPPNPDLPPPHPAQENYNHMDLFWNCMMPLDVVKCKGKIKEISKSENAVTKQRQSGLTDLVHRVVIDCSRFYSCSRTRRNLANNIKKCCQKRC